MARYKCNLYEDLGFTNTFLGHYGKYDLYIGKRGKEYIVFYHYGRKKVNSTNYYYFLDMEAALNNKPSGFIPIDNQSKSLLNKARRLAINQGHFKEKLEKIEEYESSEWQ